LSDFSPINLDHKEGGIDVNMGYADVGDGHTNGFMAEENQSLVVVLDESCCERRFDSKTHANGVPPPQMDNKCEGILSNDDIELLLSMFDTGLHPLELGTNC
jgi:hypothetical protein